MDSQAQSIARSGSHRGRGLNRHHALQLPARCIDVAPARTSDERRDTRIADGLLECMYSRIFRCMKRYLRPRVPRDQVQLDSARQLPERFHDADYFFRILDRIILAIEQYVLECDVL